MRGAPVLSRWKLWGRAGGGRDEPAVVVAAPSDGPSVEEVYHDAALQFLNIQYSGNEVLDVRTYQVFTIGSTVLPLTFALLNLTASEAPPTAGWALGAALTFYVALIFCAGRASRYRLLAYRPDIATLGEQVAAYRTVTEGGSVLREWVANEYLASITENRPLLARKGRWIGRATAMLLVECACLAIAAGLTLFL